jgi:hypothetical protein
MRGKAVPAAPDRSNAAQKPSVAKTIIDEGLTALLLR